MGALTYRQRRRAGLITRHRVWRIPAQVRVAIARKYLSREKKQKELALEFGFSQSTIARIVSNWEFYSAE
jgi:transposase-like protein